jgi:hypothetical protein
MEKTNKLNQLSENSYTSYPIIIEGRSWTVLNALVNGVDLEIRCSKLYKNNLKVKDWFRRGTISAFRMDLISENDGKIAITELGLYALAVKKQLKVKILDSVKLKDRFNKSALKHNFEKTINGKNRINTDDA